MERPKININSKDNDINLKVFCITPTVISSDENDTSIYEINIQSNFEIHNGNRRKQETPIISVTGVIRKDSTDRTNRRDARRTDSDNPFVQSYYPKMLEIKSEEAAKPPELCEVESDVEVKMLEEQTEATTEKLDKENQSPSLHSDSGLQQRLKSYIIDKFFSKNNTELKDLFQNCEKNPDGNEFHLHHHEHHHYYVQDKPLASEQSSTSSKRKESKKKKKTWESKNREERPQQFVTQTQTTDIVYQCPDVSTTYTRLNNYCDSGTEYAETKKTFVNSPLLPLSSSVSVESVFNKKSDFIKSHLYSDTDLTRSDSVEWANPGKEAKDSSCDVEVESQFRTPLIIQGQKQFSSVTCSSVENLDKVSSITIINSANLEESALTADESEDSIKETGTAKDTPGSSERKVFFEIWTAKLKTELKQIKRELRQFEQEHLKRKNLSYSLRNDDEEEEDPTQRIAVYSSKTFILGSESICLKKNCQCDEFNDAVDFSFKKSFNDTHVNRFSLCSTTKKVSAKKKKMYDALQARMLQRV